MRVTVKRRSRSLSPALFPAELLKEMQAHAGAAIAQYGTSVSDWEEKPVFTAENRPSTDGIKINVYARGDLGTRYYWIDGGFLRKVRLEKDYVPRSAPGILKSQPGRGGVLRNQNGGIVFLRTPVQAPARKFTELVRKEVEQNYRDGVRALFKKHFGR